jgi:hypothetical protein
LLAITAPFIFIFSAGFARSRKSWKILSLVSVIFLIALPSGLLLHHPIFYLLFSVLLDWLGMGSASPAESIVMISLQQYSGLIFTAYFKEIEVLDLLSCIS